MWRTITAGWLAAATIVVAAPAPKDPPKKAPSILGEWSLVSNNGERWDPSDPLIETFGTDGKLVSRRRIDGREDQETCDYSVDVKSDPARLDYLYGPKGRRTEAIFKIEGDTLTICYAARNGPRPKEFVRDGTKTFLVVYERVKSKD